jgi:hypothetical protein
MNRIFIALVLLLSAGTTFKAASQEKKEFNLILSGVPQYIITNGIRVDLDIHQKETSNWLIISPYYYFNNSSVDLLNQGGSEDYYDPYTYDRMIGVGLGIGRRTFLSKEPVSHGVYLNYGATYKYFNIDGDNFTWVEQTGSDGLQYIEMTDIKYTMNVHSMAANAVIGYQTQIIPSLYLDIFFGFGVKYAVHSSPEDVKIKYNRASNDYGFTGTHLVAGIRFGIGI